VFKKSKDLKRIIKGPSKLNFEMGQECYTLNRSDAVYLASVRSPTSAYRTLHGAPPVGLRGELIPNMVMLF